MTKIYLVGSLRNTLVPKVAKLLREKGFEVFDDWFSPGPEADDHWQEYEKNRGRTYKEALNGWHAQAVFAIDKRHLDDSDVAIMVMPAGKSAHLEIGYMAGRGKDTFILFDKEPERFDIMPNFCTDVFMSVDELVEYIDGNYEA